MILIKHNPSFLIHLAHSTCLVGMVVYYYCGTYASSPALGTAGPVVKKVAYGIALPDLFVTAILLAHVRHCTLLIKFQANQR